MKKGKVLGKGQIAVAVMLLALGAAIWLNTKYMPSNSKYLGEASYVNNTTDEGDTVETAAKAESKKDYFTTEKANRERAREEAVETIEELLKSEKLSDEDKKGALAKIEKIGDTIEKESNIEALLKAKGFEKVLVVISDAGISVVVKSEGLTSPQTLQIQDIVTGETDIELSKIKIIPVV